LLTVVLPTLIAVVYFGLMASDAYISESRFVIRNPQHAAPSGLGALLQGTVLSRSQDETYSVLDFFQSRDALRELDSKLHLRDAYSSRNIDLLSRFPGLDWDHSFEAFFRYYTKQIEVDYDSASSIAVLKVRAYSPEQAQQINESLLQMGERLVNNLNLHSREDLINVAEQEVRAAEANDRAAADALSKFRGQRQVFDPAHQGQLQLESVSRMEDDLQAAESELTQLLQVSPHNPQIPALRSRIDGLRHAVADRNQRIAGGNQSLASASPVYDRLALEKDFADHQLAAALASLDSARSEANRKQLYLERLVQPNLPDSSVEPRRLRAVLTVFLLGLVLCGVVKLIVASVNEHLD
jgi:capsular polysaccharide transport system permease protein